MQSKALSAYKDIAFKGFKLPNEKISRQYAGTDLFPRCKFNFEKTKTKQ